MLYAQLTVMSCTPLSRALSSMPSSSIASMVALAAAQPMMLPPYVPPCTQGLVKLKQYILAEDRELSATVVTQGSVKYNNHCQACYLPQLHQCQHLHQHSL